jgi:hypothetical protein
MTARSEKNGCSVSAVRAGTPQVHTAMQQASPPAHRVGLGCGIALHRKLASRYSCLQLAAAA